MLGVTIRKIDERKPWFMNDVSDLSLHFTHSMVGRYTNRRQRNIAERIFSSRRNSVVPAYLHHEHLAGLPDVETTIAVRRPFSEATVVKIGSHIHAYLARNEITLNEVMYTSLIPVDARSCEGCFI
jgi:hypothetical protein